MWDGAYVFSVVAVYGVSFVSVRLIFWIGVNFISYFVVVHCLVRLFKGVLGL